MYKGIDVSYHNGKIDWKKVKNAGIDFAILRIGFGMYADQKDTSFEYNYTECIKNNIPIGVYLYSYAKNKNEAKREAETVLTWLNKRKLNLPVYFDIEDKSQINLSKSVLDSMCKMFCDTIENAGYWAGIYTNKYWATSIINGTELGKRYTYWVAQYNNENTYNGPYDMWQYTSSGKVNGINGNVDLNYLYRDIIKEIDNEIINVTYQTYDTKKKIWLPNVTNMDDYAGNFGNSVSGLYANTSKGKITYRVHQKGGSWLPEVVNLEDYAGNLGKPIDGLQMKATDGTIYYRVHLKNGAWLPWVAKWDNTSNGYAGIYGREIDAIQMYIK